jgi:sec-independent protein translocase protein TatB
VFDLNISKLLVLAVIALVVFGPKELPKIAAQAGRALRELRRMAEGAKADLREGLGPEFADFDIEDLNPRRFVQKHLLDDLNGNDVNGTAVNGAGVNGHDGTAEAAYAASGGSRLRPGEEPPYDAEAT